MTLDTSGILDSSTDDVSDSAILPKGEHRDTPEQKNEAETESRRSKRLSMNTAAKPGDHLEAAVAKLKRAVEESTVNS